MRTIGRGVLAAATFLSVSSIAQAADAEPDDAPAGAPHASRKAALALFQRALQLEPKIGVVKDIERLNSWLNKHPPAAAPAADADEAKE